MAKVVVNAEYSGHSESANRVVTLRLEAGSNQVLIVPELVAMCDQEIMLKWDGNRVGKFTLHEAKIDRNGMLFIMLKGLAEEVQDQSIFDVMAQSEIAKQFVLATKSKKEEE